MSRLSEWVITLRIKYNLDDTLASPDKWDWDKLLDLRGDEEVILEKSEFIQDIEDENE